jgi:protein involved in polysaccharide export with SLBB domain
MRSNFSRLIVLLSAAVLAVLPAQAQQSQNPERVGTPLLGQTAQPSDEDAAETPDRRTNGVDAGSGFGPVGIEGEERAAGRRESDSDRIDRLERLQTNVRKPIVPSEFELYVERTLGRKLPRLGNDLLIPEARDFELPATATVPADYVLGPGDSVEINLTGSIEGSFGGTIDNDGRLLLPRVGPVVIAGVRYGDLQARVTQAIGRQFRNFKAAVSVRQLRGIRVYVTGFAASPGAYTVNSLSTMVNAVLAAGGPSSGGSFRKATLMRGGRMVSELDLYDLLLRGDRSRDAVLQNEDVINIAPLGEQAAMIGSVNNEAVYEVKPGESLEALLALAGGPAVLADPSRLMLFRNKPNEPLVGREIARAEAPRVAAVGGDIVTVVAAGSLLQPQGRQSVLVRLEGEVARPGNYLVSPGTSLDAVLDLAGGLTRQAFVYGTRLDRLSVKRQQREGFVEAVNQLELALAASPLTSSNLNEAEQARALASARAVLDRLRTADPDGRLVLDLPSTISRLPGGMVMENDDRILIPPRPSAVGVFGAVYRPASFMLQGDRGLRVRDYIARAGGPIRAADAGRLFVVRANGELLTKKMGALNAPALPGDVIFMPVRTQSNNLLARIRDISTIIFQLGITTAALIAITQ